MKETGGQSTLIGALLKTQPELFKAHYQVSTNSFIL
jgi:hypothetical protein